MGSQNRKDWNWREWHECCVVVGSGPINPEQPLASHVLMPNLRTKIDQKFQKSVKNQLKIPRTENVFSYSLLSCACVLSMTKTHTNKHRPSLFSLLTAQRRAGTTIKPKHTTPTSLSSFLAQHSWIAERCHFFSP